MAQVIGRGEHSWIILIDPSILSIRLLGEVVVADLNVKAAAPTIPPSAALPSSTNDGVELCCCCCFLEVTVILSIKVHEKESSTKLAMDRGRC